MKELAVFGFCLGAIVLIVKMIYDAAKRGDWGTIPFLGCVILFVFRGAAFKYFSDQVNGHDVLRLPPGIDFLLTDWWFFGVTFCIWLSTIIYFLRGTLFKTRTLSQMGKEKRDRRKRGRRSYD